MLPLEDEEQQVFVEWLEFMGLRVTSIPNSTYTKSWSQKAKNHRTGLRPGFPDLVVLIPPNRSRDGEGYLLAIEMKRRKRGVVSSEQRAWIDAINGLETPHAVAYVCKGAPAAIDLVMKYIKHEPETVSLF